MPAAVFANLELATALERATAEGKLLLVDATAEWCGPCQMMERTTWADADVTKWLGERAVAIQIDVDAQKQLARELRIQAMPTIIAFRDGKEFDRVVGAQRPKELLAWLDGVMRGETTLAIAERTARNEPTNMRARMGLARELLAAGRYAESLVEHLWLWDHMLEHQASLHGVRHSFFASQLERLAKAHPPAREAIMRLRDQAAPSESGAIASDTFTDWNCLNGVLGEAERTLAWYDALPAGSRPTGRILENHLVPLLIAAGRWADAGAAYEDPLATINRLGGILKLPPEGPAEMEGHMRDLYRKQAANVVRALAAAGRKQDLEQVVQRALELDPSDELRAALATASA